MNLPEALNLVEDLQKMLENCCCCTGYCYPHMDGLVDKIESLKQFIIEKLEKDLNINQEPPEPYCSDCGRGGS